MEQSHGGAGGAEGRIKHRKGKQSKQQAEQKGGRGRRRRGQIGQIAQHRAQTKQGGSDVTAEHGGDYRRGLGAIAGAQVQGRAERRDGGGTGRAERRDTQMARAGRKQHGRAG